jgi:hypothetical protein
MISLAGSIALILVVILVGKVRRKPGPLPLVALLLVTAFEVAIVFYYMYSLEVPVQ